ncbi:hypothetical protein [Methylibium petroleiphilum]|uniref:hypothetical protein n=1 Tax=Methylibium petroleiphilum TaxID=105560 RepID=UPI00235630FC|nr:hypothetical protein [Methylibium petroleiphilum]
MLRLIRRVGLLYSGRRRLVCLRNLDAGMRQFAARFRQTGIRHARQQREHPHEQHREGDAALVVAAGGQGHVRLASCADSQNPRWKFRRSLHRKG